MSSDYQAWREKRDSEAATREEFKKSYETAMSEEGLDPKPAPTIEQEMRSLREQVATLTQQLTPKVTRSKMSNAEKARYISELGSTAYFQIPWD